MLVAFRDALGRRKMPPSSRMIIPRWSLASQISAYYVVGPCLRVEDNMSFGN